MKRLAPFAYSLFIAVVVASFALAADTPPTIATLYNAQLSSLEKEVVSLAEAMPGDKYDFAPTNGEFKGVRTFGKQIKHIAASIFECAAGVLGEPLSKEKVPNDNGPDNMTSKEEIVSYLKEAFAYAHKAFGTLKEGSLTTMVSAFGEKMSKVGAANIVVWHSYDHYGQCVVYARMNGIVPPASRQAQ